MAQTGDAFYTVRAWVEGFESNIRYAQEAALELARQLRWLRIHRVARRMVYGSLPWYRRLFVARP